MKIIGNNKLFNFLVAVLVILIIATVGKVFTNTNAEISHLSAHDGILDLTGWNPNQDGILSLQGQWDFYWKRFLTNQELQSMNPVPDIEADVPSVWTNYQVNGDNLPGFGYATYHLKVINADKEIPLSLRIPTMSTAYRLYIDDKLVSSSGTAAADKEQFIPQYKIITVQIPPSAKEFDIIVQVSNFVYSRGGMWYAVNMGTAEQIQDLNRHIIYRDIFLFSSFFILGLYYLCIFLIRREDKSSLYFTLMCFVAMGRTIIHGDYVIYNMLPFISFGTIVFINYATLYWFPTTFTLLLRELFPDILPKKVVQGTVIYATGMTLFTLLAPLHFYTRYTYFILPVVVLISSYTVVFTVIAFLKKKQDSLLVLFGTIAIVSGAAYDILCYYRVITYNVGELSSFGFFIFLSLQSFILARRSARALQDVNNLSIRLLEIDKLKDEFFANTSHELTTPLNGIMGITEAMLRGSEGELNEGQRQNLDIIAMSSRRLTHLVNDILDYSRLKHKDLELDIKPVRISSVVDTTLLVFRHLNNNPQLEIQSELSGNLPPVMADENRLAQIIYNLVGNAVKFTTRGKVRVTAEPSGGTMRICVEDTGPGIPKDKFDDIFRSFEQVDSSLTRKRGGTGLGLYISRHLVESQGGKIWVDSALGKGSQFYFTLPICGELPKEPETDKFRYEAAAAVWKTQDGTIREIGAGPHILLVDDEIINLHAVVSILKIENYSITAVNSGLEALKTIRRYNNICLVILDVMMPDMSGYEVCRQIRETKSAYDLPVLMLTAKTIPRDIVVGLEAGANDYLSKPVEPEELLARVKTLINLKQSVDKARAAETAFLQAQIKPHFLFNVLNTISSFCDTEPELAGELINELANYLRQSFDFENLEMFVHLERELQLIHSYLTIEKARFGDELNIELTVDDGIEIEIPPLSIQPLVENAIRHGLRKKAGGGIVRISIRKIPGGIQVNVGDDGLGITVHDQETILEGDSKRGVGIRNIDSRLKKLYGHGLTLYSEAGKGTEISFIIPYGGDTQ